MRAARVFSWMAPSTLWKPVTTRPALLARASACLRSTRSSASIAGNHSLLHGGPPDRRAVPGRGPSRGLRLGVPLLGGVLGLDRRLDPAGLDAGRHDHGLRVGARDVE